MFFEGTISCSPDQTTSPAPPASGLAKINNYLNLQEEPIGYVKVSRITLPHRCGVAAAL